MTRPSQAASATFSSRVVLCDSALRGVRIQCTALGVRPSNPEQHGDRPKGRAGFHVTPERCSLGG
jgi:hypothetical protein